MFVCFRVCLVCLKIIHHRCTCNNAGVVTYTGLAIGALLWGCMADRVGRRRTLLTALTLASIFDLMAALMPTFGTFLTARLLGGLG